MPIINFKSAKIQLILYLICFAVFLAFKDHDLRFLFLAFVAVFSSLIVESALRYLKTKSFQITESPIITGLIISYVLSGDQRWWIFVLSAALAILSKYLIRFHGRHIFNPAGFGIFLILLAGGFSQWRGTYLWYIVVPLGIYFLLKIRKQEIIIGYTAVSFLLFGVQAFLQHLPLSNVFGYFSYFFIFVMVIEPMTSPIRPVGKFIFGAGVAGLIFIFTQAGVKFDAELASLLLMNITVPFLNKRR